MRFVPTGSRDADVRSILLTLNGMLEGMVREFPEQYLWVHRRWRELRAPQIAKIARLPKTP
jgi:KDO2-lipid IV(A) lauroyltransferase